MTFLGADADWADLTGFFGGVVLALMMVPQTWKCWRTKSAEDLSWGFLCMYGLGLSLLATFAIAKGLWPIYVPGLVEISMLIMQSTMKMVYDRAANEAKLADESRATARVDGRIVEAVAPAASQINPFLLVPKP